MPISETRIVNASNRPLRLPWGGVLAIGADVVFTQGKQDLVRRDRLMGLEFSKLIHSGKIGVISSNVSEPQPQHAEPVSVVTPVSLEDLKVADDILEQESEVVEEPQIDTDTTPVQEEPPVVSDVVVDQIPSDTAIDVIANTSDEQPISDVVTDAPAVSAIETIEKSRRGRKPKNAAID